jgi:outer membrane protein assembly factor BamB
VFLTPLDERGAPGAAIPVIPKGSQLQQAIPMNGGGFVIAADQSPLSFRKLSGNGNPVWVRVLSSKLALPTVAVFPDDSICISAQLSTGELPQPTLELMRLDSLGVVTKEIPISAAQGAVAAGQDGECAVLYSATFESRARRLTMFDAKLNRKWDVPVPLIGASGGRTYTLDTLSDGFLATELTGARGEHVVAKFSTTGDLLWTEPLPSGFERLVPAVSGSYLIMVGMVGGDHNEALRISKIRIE